MKRRREVLEEEADAKAAMMPIDRGAFLLVGPDSQPEITTPQARSMTLWGLLSTHIHPDLIVSILEYAHSVEGKVEMTFTFKTGGQARNGDLEGSIAVDEEEVVLLDNGLPIPSSLFSPRWEISSENGRISRLSEKSGNDFNRDPYHQSSWLHH